MTLCEPCGALGPPALTSDAPDAKKFPAIWLSGYSPEYSEYVPSLVDLTLQNGGDHIIPLRAFGWIDDCAVEAQLCAGRQAGLVHMRCPKNVQHSLALAEQIIGDDAPMTSPPDGLDAQDCAPVLAARFPQSHKACGESLRQRIVGIIPKAADPLISVAGRLGAFYPPAKAAKFRDTFVAHCHGANVSGRLSPLNCGLVRDCGIYLTSTTKLTRDSWSRSTNSTIVRLE